MRRFAQLYTALDESNRTSQKLAVLVRYFAASSPGDAAWAVYFLTGHRPKQLVKSAHLRAWAREAAGLAEWLFDESYDAVGDLAETIALVLPPATADDDAPLREWVEQRLLPLKGLDEAEQRRALTEYWQTLAQPSRFVLNKLITGGFRVGVSTGLVHKALAQVAGVAPSDIAARLMGGWTPSPENYCALIARESPTARVNHQPYPFMLANAHEALQNADDVARVLAEQLGEIDDWLAEWKWDGIRAQLIKRNGEIYLWSRGEEEISAQFPELIAAAARLPDCVLDGEVVVAQGPTVQPFATLQTRLNRKAPSKKLLETAPTMLLCYDVLEISGQDLRGEPLERRRRALANLIYSIAWQRHEPMRLGVSTRIRAPSWATLARARQDARSVGAEGLMLKRVDSKYTGGRTRGDWWKWKLDPFTLDCVLMYAQRGHGKRASLYTDYTFGIWRDSHEGRELVPFAKAYTGLTDGQIREVDAFIRRHRVEAFGPVRTVPPTLVFELAFEGIQTSRRHKSGIAVRFPRIARIRPDKRAEEANSVADALALMRSQPDKD